MAKKALSAKYIEALPYTDKRGDRHWDAKLAGLCLEVGKTTKSFFFEHKGKRSRIGRYPDVSVDDARTRAAEIMSEAAVQEITSPTLEKAMMHYLERTPLRSEHNKKSVEAQMRTHMSKFLKRRLHTISKKEIEQAFDAITKQRMGKDSLGRPTKIGGTRAANHTMMTFRTIWNHAKRRMTDGLKDCPTEALYFHPEDGDPEIIEDLDAWHAEVFANEMPSVHRAVYRLLLTTGMRKTECLSLTWDQIDRERRVIHLPETVTKNGRAFDIPLEPEHENILLACVDGNGDPLHNRFVFPGRSWATHLKAPTPISWTAQTHRSTFATLGVRAGLAVVQVGRLLNHTIPGVTAKHYIKTEVETYRPWMRQVLDSFASRV